MSYQMTATEGPLVVQSGELMSPVKGIIAYANRTNPKTTPVERDETMKKLAMAYTLHDELVDMIKALILYEDDIPPAGSFGDELYKKAMALLTRAAI